ncbi:hypothetical protein [Microvirga solisilvae]|uniref:hypothetical protein n=1 Tax=Microvirga solisilvae TaxID=2919498 RepID=UPI001FAF630F|nr:hypothetical protein [Microvirga solisilvae]
MDRIEELPNGHIRVTFEKPIMDAGGDLKVTATLRPPTCGEVLDFGDVSAFVLTGKNMGMEVDDPEAIKAYLGVIITDHDFEIIAKRGAPSDALALKEAVKRFFASARKKLQPSPAPSSSTGDQTRSPSTEPA